MHCTFLVNKARWCHHGSVDFVLALKTDAEQPLAIKSRRLGKMRRMTAPSPYQILTGGLSIAHAASRKRNKPDLPPTDVPQKSQIRNISVQCGQLKSKPTCNFKPTAFNFEGRVPLSEENQMIHLVILLVIVTAIAVTGYQNVLAYWRSRNGGVIPANILEF